MKTPVAFLIFNRPELTARVFEAIRRAQPPLLLVVADGPRAGRPGEAELCAAARSVIERVDWDCQVLTEYADTNMGCKRRVASGLDWVFQTVEEAIILEDDCLPHPSFFPFCEALLEHYRADERIMMVSGTNILPESARGRDSYFFSRYVQIWGWASWRRAWRHYDADITQWQTVKADGWLHDILAYPHRARRWTRLLDTIWDGTLDTWDYQWMLACWLQNGLCALPSVNTVSNIGFLPGAAHLTADRCDANLPARELVFPLRHPASFVPDRRVEDAFDRINYPNWPARIGNRARRLLHRARPQGD